MHADHSTEGSQTSGSTGQTVARTCFCVGVFFGLLLLCNGVAMYQSAGHLEYGPTRDFWRMVLRPVDQVSRVTGLCHVRGWAQTTVGEWLNQPNKE